MSRCLLLASMSFCAAAPAFAQHQDHGRPQPTPQQQEQNEQRPAPSADPHAQHGQSGKPPAVPDDHAGHDMAGHGGMENTAAGEAIDPPEAGNDAPPVAPADFAADRIFAVGDMNRARGILRDEHGAAVTYKIMGDMLEYRSQAGEAGYAWNGEAWLGGDIDRVVLRTEGEGDSDIESAEIQALYSRAWDHVTDLQLGIRQDAGPNPSRTYLVLGFDTVLPYWFDVEGAVFIGERGQVLGRFDGSFDLQLTQRLVLQPRAEVNFATNADPAIGLGAGLSDAEVGLRLRYEFQREFAPYIGIAWERKFGGTADYARDAGARAETASFVVGLRAWY